MKKRNHLEKEALIKHYAYLIDMYEKALTEEYMETEEIKAFVRLFFKNKEEANKKSMKEKLSDISTCMKEKENMKDWLYQIFLSCIQNKPEYDQYIDGDFRHAVKLVCENQMKKRKEEVKNELIKKMQQAKEGQEQEGVSESAGMDFKKWVQGVNVQAPFEKLTKREREILVMSHVQKWTDSEIGEKLNLTGFEVKEKRAKAEEKVRKEKKSEDKV
jgi:hypothetical protein